MENEQNNNGLLKDLSKEFANATDAFCNNSDQILLAGLEQERRIQWQNAVEERIRNIQQQDPTAFNGEHYQIINME